KLPTIGICPSTPSATPNKRRAKASTSLTTPKATMTAARMNSGASASTVVGAIGGTSATRRSIGYAPAVATSVSYAADNSDAGLAASAANQGSPCAAINASSGTSTLVRCGGRPSVGVYCTVNSQ